MRSHFPISISAVAEWPLRQFAQLGARPPLPARVRLRAYCRPEPGRSQNSSPASLTRPTPHPANAFNHSKRSLLHSSTYPSQLYLHMQIQLGCNSRGLIDTVLTRCSCTYGYNPLQMRSCPREGLRSDFCIQFALLHIRFNRACNFRHEICKKFRHQSTPTIWL